MGSKPGAVYWMDIFRIDLLYNCIVCLKKLKINEERCGVGPFKKTLLFNGANKPEKSIQFT